MLNYLLEMLVCQALFLGFYQLIKSETFFRVNRFYLLATLVVSLVLPLINFSQALPFIVSQTYVEWLQPIQIGAGTSSPLIQSTNVVNFENTTDFQWNIYFIAYALGLCCYIIWFLFRNRKLFHYLNLNSFEDYKFVPLVIIPKSGLAFSFLDRIYLGTNIPESQRQVILEHEYQHLKQKHSWDILLLESLQCLMWFNPLIYLFKNHLRQIHEFEADFSVTTSHPRLNYINILLNQSFGSQNVSFINAFSQPSNLKKRIKMLQHPQSTTIKKLKYLLIIPILFLVFLMSCSQEELIEPEMTEEELNEESIDFMMRLFNEKPTLYDRTKDKQGLKTILNAYDLKIKDNYTELEKRKVQAILAMVTMLSKNEKAYHESILDDVKKYKSLELAYNEIQKRLSDRKGLMRSETEIEEFKVGKYNGSTDIPFSLIDNPPHPFSCDDLTGDELKKCVSEFISVHVHKNFDTGLAKKLGLSGRNRISVQFKIDNTGHVVNIRARGPHPKLEEEAKRVIQSLPQMIPGQIDNENVGVLYGLPINFIIQ